MHVFGDQRLHLQRVEVFLEYRYVAHSRLNVFELTELDEEKVVQGFEVTLHIANTNTQLYLLKYIFHLSRHLHSHSSHFFVVGLVLISVLIQPVLSILHRRVQPLLIHPQLL